MHSRPLPRVLPANSRADPPATDVSGRELRYVVFKAPSTQEARKAIEQDPAVRAGRIAIEYHEWWTADRVLPW